MQTPPPNTRTQIVAAQIAEIARGGVMIPCSTSQLSDDVATPKGTLSAAARRRISAVQRKRWAEAKKLRRSIQGIGTEEINLPRRSCSAAVNQAKR